MEIKNTVLYKKFANLSKRIDFLEQENNINKKEMVKIKHLFKEIGDIYFTFCIMYFEDEKAPDHFVFLTKYFNLYDINDNELSKKELEYLRLLQICVQKYKKEYSYYYILPEFLYSFKKFENYCEKKNKQKHLSLVKEIFEKLNKIYGKKEILRQIKIHDCYLTKELNKK